MRKAKPREVTPLTVFVFELLFECYQGNFVFIPTRLAAEELSGR